MKSAGDVMALSRILAAGLVALGTLAASAALDPAEAQTRRFGGGGFYGGGYRAPAFRPYVGGYGYRPYVGGYGYRPYYGGYGYRPYYNPWWAWAPAGLGLGQGLAWGAAAYAPPAYYGVPYAAPEYYAPGYGVAPGYPPQQFVKPGEPYGIVPGSVPAPAPASAWPRASANSGICQAGPVTCGMPGNLPSGAPCSCPAPGGAFPGVVQ